MCIILRPSSEEEAKPETRNFYSLLLFLTMFSFLFSGIILINGGGEIDKLNNKHEKIIFTLKTNVNVFVMHN
jgi:hypothetical protein